MPIDQDLRNLLLEAGLTEAEILIYLELLKSPATTRWELVSRTKLGRNMVYRGFERLSDFNLVAMSETGIEALSLDNFLQTLNNRARGLARKIKRFLPFLKIPTEAIEKFEVADDSEKILSDYMLMSQVKYDTCLDFGDLENFVPVLGGIELVFKFRMDRYKQNAKNRAICTTVGPYTSCMCRKHDMNSFKSNIDLLKIDFKDKWIIFSDTDDRVMFNDFSDCKNPSSVLIKSKVVADAQRAMFEQFSRNIKKF